MAIGDYLSKNKASVLYIKEVLENYSSIEKPLSNADIRRILAEYPYNMDIHRDTVKEVLIELNAFNEDLYCCNFTDQKGRDGYNYAWYYNRSSSTYENIKDIIKDIYYNPLLPSDQARDKAKELLTLIPSSYVGSTKKEVADLNLIPVKQNELSEEAYQIFQQLRQIIKENRANPRYEKYVKFNVYTHTIRNKKHRLVKNISHFHEVLPLAIVEWNYHYWMICLIELTGKLAHMRIDLMCDLEIIEKFKNKSAARKKLKDKVGSSDQLREYLNEHIYMGDSTGLQYLESEKVVTANLKIRKDRHDSINYFYDIYQDNFKVLDEQENYYLVSVRGTERAIKNTVINNIGLIELTSPENLLLEIHEEIRNILNNISINTNDIVLRNDQEERKRLYKYKVSKGKNIFLFDFYSINLDFRKSLDSEDLKLEKEFYQYLKDIGFKKERTFQTSFNIKRILLESTNFSNSEEIAELIKDFVKHHRSFYKCVTNYTIYKVVYNKDTDRYFYKEDYVYNANKSTTNSIMSRSFGSYLYKLNNK